MMPFRAFNILLWLDRKVRCGCSLLFGRNELRVNQVKNERKDSQALTWANSHYPNCVVLVESKCSPLSTCDDRAWVKTIPAPTTPTERVYHAEKCIPRTPKKIYMYSFGSTQLSFYV